MIYPKLLYWSVKTNALKRKQEAHSAIDEKIAWIYIVIYISYLTYKYGIEHITDISGPEIRNLLNDKKHDYLFVSPKVTHKLTSMGEDFCVISLSLYLSF